MSYPYDSQFMEYSVRSSGHSAAKVIRILRRALPIESVLDVGCAHGTWLKEWQASGVQDVHGVDGEYVDVAGLAILPCEFTSADLSYPVSLNRTFDLVQSLEVGEHITPSASATFVEGIVEHSRGVVLFSAAPPGQGGEFHINERPYEFWRALFRSHNFFPFDYVRPLISEDRSISFWYRLNTLLYIRSDRIHGLDLILRKAQIPEETPIPDFSSVAFKVRKAVVRQLPYSAQHKLARLKARFLPSGSF